MNIIRTDKTILLTWWMAWVAILLTTYGLPSLTARMIGLPADSVRLNLLNGRDVLENDLAALEKTRLKVANWFPLNENYDDLALVATQRSKGAVAQQVLTHYHEAEFWQRKALMISPADPYGWYRLSFLYYVANGASAQAADAWRQSMASAPYEPRLAVSRLQMAMSLGSFVGDDSRFWIEELIRCVWYDDPDHLAKLAYDGHYISFAEAALGNDPESLQDFQHKIKSMQ